MMVIALVLAIAAVLVAARWINAKASNSTNKVAVAHSDIALGSRINPESVKMVDWPANAVPQGAITDAKLLELRVARTTIQAGDLITEPKLAPPGTQGSGPGVAPERAVIDGQKKSGRITAITTRGRPFKVIVRPTIDGSAPKRRFHNACERTTADGSATLV